MDRTEMEKKGVAYITVNVTTSPHSSKTKLPLTLSKNDLDSVDILQLVFTRHMCISSAAGTHVHLPHSMLEVKRQQVGMQNHGSEHNEVITLWPQPYDL